MTPTPFTPAPYRKRDVQIVAAQFVGGRANATELVTWMREHDTNALWFEAVDDRAEFLQITTLEGVMKARVGDWIVQGVAQEFYPVKPEIFLNTYRTALPMPSDRNRSYRTGRKNARNIYAVDEGSTNHEDDIHIGVMFEPDDGQLVVLALNDYVAEMDKPTPNPAQS